MNNKSNEIRIKVSFRRAQWRMLVATMFCYLFFYNGFVILFYVLLFFLFMMFFTSGISANELDTNDQMRYQSLIQEVRCLVCQNQSVAESNAELA